jgi:putative acetyltransferase
MSIRDEQDADRAAIREVVEAAFGRRDEADLVDRLRVDGRVVISLVEVEGEPIVGLDGEAIVGSERGPIAGRPSMQSSGTFFFRSWMPLSRRWGWRRLRSGPTGSAQE